MRLRLAPVEYKVCSTPDCDTKYEGAQCPQCRRPFDAAATRKELADRLILVDVDPPFYEPQQRCRCTACKGIFDIREEVVVLRARCEHCQQPLFSRESLHQLWSNADTLLQRARILDRARRQLSICPHCTQPLPTALWCPLASSLSHPLAASTLPQNFLVAWVRTFQTRESIEELQIREWQEEEPDNSWRINESAFASDDADEEEEGHAK
jgi:hypothetical protein